jgi:hypothetical protein
MAAGSEQLPFMLLAAVPWFLAAGDWGWSAAVLAASGLLIAAWTTQRLSAGGLAAIASSLGWLYASLTGLLLQDSAPSFVLGTPPFRTLSSDLHAGIGIYGSRHSGRTPGIRPDTSSQPGWQSPEVS